MKIYAFTRVIASCLLFISCNKEDETANPFENATALDCNNLRVRKVELIEMAGVKEFRVYVENTCLACGNLPVYESVYIINKLNNDTIGVGPCGRCISVPNNKEIEVYVLNTTLQVMPNIDEMKFSIETTCRDIKYEPK